MKINKPFDETDEDEYLFGKFTNDGGYINQFIKEQHLPYRRRPKIPEEKIDVDISALEKTKPLEKEVKEPIVAAEECVENDQNQGVIDDLEEVVESTGIMAETPKKTVKMTLRELFDYYYDGYSKMPWKQRWSKMMSGFSPYIGNEQRRKEFLQVNFKRKRHNEKTRKTRLTRKMSVNGFNYFVTFTYDDAKMSAEQFKKKLKDYLKNNVSRYGWKYIGVWEGWDGSVRLHFHALMYIADDAMPGENFVETKYNPVTKQMETHTRNTEFNEKFGLSTVEPIIEVIRNQAYEYILKYMNKGGKMMMSRNCPTFIKGWVKKNELVGPTNEDETCFLMAANAEVVLETGEVVKLEPERLYKVLPMATTCN